jgi:sulfite oxidase
MDMLLLKVIQLQGMFILLTSSGGRGINRVDVSHDGGKTWTDAELLLPPQPRGRHWAWTLWEAKIPVSGEKELDLVCKAVDSAYNTQPDNFEGIYNARGVLVSAWQRLKAKVDYPKNSR